MSGNVSDVVWHVDGHQVSFRLRKDRVDVLMSSCPFDGQEGGECFHEHTKQCLVKYFIDVFGLEVNSGESYINSPMNIAWSVIGESWDLDGLTFYFLPVDDPVFAAWLEGNGG